MFIESPPRAAAAAPAAAGSGGSDGTVGSPDATTRDRVLRHVSELGPVTAGSLADLLDLTPAAVRRHLDALLETGEISVGGNPAAAPRGRGRPARSYVVTPVGHRRLDTDYADIAAAAMRFLADELGPGAIEAFARRRFEDVERRYAEVVDAAGDDTQARAGALALALGGDGFAASTRPVGMHTPLEGVQLCQGHCPVQRVAAEFPQLCDAETNAFARLLGVHVQRLATQAGGAHVCTTFVPAALDRSSGPPSAIGPPEAGRSGRRPATVRGHGAPTESIPPDPTTPDTTPPTPADERTPR